MQRLILFVVTFLSFYACTYEKPAPKEEDKKNPVLDQLSQQIEINPEVPDSWLARANYYYENDTYELAIADLLQGLRKDTTHLPTLHLLADAYLDYFQSRRAIETLEYASSIHPSSIITLLKKSEFHLILKQYEESMKTIDQILQQDPQNAEAYFMFGQNFVELKDTVRAINSYQTAVENDPELIDAWIKLGQLHGALGNSIAPKFFESGIRIAPEHIEIRHAKADYLADKDKLDEALATYRDIVMLNPDYEEAYFNSGLIYLDLDSFPQALQQFDICIKTSPIHIRAYYYRGLTAELLGNLSAAERDYQQALAMASDFVEAQEGLNRVREEMQ